MAIKCKKHLINTYIENDNGVLRDTYLKACEKHIAVDACYENRHPDDEHLYFHPMYCHLQSGRCNTDNYKQLHLSDLIDLKNTKVYSLDEEAIRKYAALCGLPLYMDHDIYGSPVGYAEKGSIVTCFVKFSIDDTCRIRRTITPDQINALYDEKFGKVETPEEKEAFEVMTKATSHAIGTEWKNGDECTYDGSKYIFVGMTPTLNDVACIIFDHKNGIEHVSVNKLRKPETKRKERERLEAAYDLFVEWQRDDEFDLERLKSFEDFKRDSRTTSDWLRVVEKTGYRKQKDGE